MMGRMISFRVINNRMQFKCGACGTKRNLPVQASIRKKSVRCHKCEAITRCVLNRRAHRRELQSGKATMITDEGKEVIVNIHDISSSGIGFEIPIRAARAGTIKIGEEVRFNCKWNPRLLGSGNFKIINSNGQRVGIKRI